MPLVHIFNDLCFFYSVHVFKLVTSSKRFILFWGGLSFTLLPVAVLVSNYVWTLLW